MGQSQFIIDTNIVIDYLGNKIPEMGMKFMNNIIDIVPNISIITKIEVLGFNTIDEYYNTLTNFIDDAEVFELDNRVVEITISIRKNHKIKLPDAIIAATALAHNMILISRNISDFKKIEELEVVDPYRL